MDAERNSHLNIAIDGPSASGKSAVGNEVARRLGIRFLDTGTMYRAVAWAAMERDISPKDSDELSALVESASMCLVPHADGDRLVFAGEDITDNLRLPEVDAAVSPVSAVSAVRRALVAQQRAIAADTPIVMVGRDIGTVALPAADVKVFLTASAEVRAARRHAEMLEQQSETDYEQVLEGLLLRDRIDSDRDDSPLRPARDAAIICSDNMTIDEVATEIVSLVKRC